MSDVHSNHISNEDLQTATDYIDQILVMIRDARWHGIAVSVEELTIMLVTAIIADKTPEMAAIARLSLITSTCLQRLA